MRSICTADSRLTSGHGEFHRRRALAIIFRSFVRCAASLPGRPCAVSQLIRRFAVPEPLVVWPADYRLVYVADLDATPAAAGLVLELGTEKRGDDGTWGPTMPFTLPAAVWLESPNAADKAISEMLLASARSSLYGQVPGSGFVIGARALATTLRAICDTGRLRTRSADPARHGRTLSVDTGAAWRLALRVTRPTTSPDTPPEDIDYVLQGEFVRSTAAKRAAGSADPPRASMALTEPWLVHHAGFMISGDEVSLLDHGGAYSIIAELREAPQLSIGADVTALLEQVYALSQLPDLELPSDVVVQESQVDPLPIVTIGGDDTVLQPNRLAPLTLEFLYGGVRVNATSAANLLYDRSLNVVHHRRWHAEHEALSRLRALGAGEERIPGSRARQLTVSREKMSAMAFELVHDGWQVHAFGLMYRAPSRVRAMVQSGIDWFDVSGLVSYGDLEASAADLLAARRRGDELYEFADGSLGIMPNEWLDQFEPLLPYGVATEGGTRFKKSQLALLDALLDTLPEIDVDATFARAREELARFDHIAPVDPPPSFRGALRDYQREGLGWMHFLRRFGLGGCLADDMGLGKTIQVLALLESRRVEGAGPSIIVVPRSLVFNWLREAERFTPAMRVLDHSDLSRRIGDINASEIDVVITTYGTLRSDAGPLSAITFDYAILDEAQAIKNAGTATAKACRLLRANHRLALSGTPIENRIEELWSLLEFLNPGMMSASARFASLGRLAPSSSTSQTQTADRTLLARALRPIILRRKKEDVATELPARVEQTLEVEMEPEQRRVYEDIRVHFQRSVIERVERDGVQKSRMHILEALLRLRQAACHPALIDVRHATVPCAKLDALVPALQEIAEEGHKSIVFSQFTSFLSLVRQRLDTEGIVYEYLDGRTRDREARVDRFQNDPDCPVFLISLKAGGHGLNLTAADYVYLLDPWWNPAVEAQAIDRAHRIGQSRHVIATRVIARDTIEAKILQLQDSKRALADAILTADKGILASIGREELELLLA